VKPPPGNVETFCVLVELRADGPVAEMPSLDELRNRLSPGTNGPVPVHSTYRYVTYRHTSMPGEAALAWKVWVSECGDVLVDKRDGSGLTRPRQTVNDGYLIVSIRRQLSGGDPYMRRRVHEWVAHAFCGSPPSPAAIVEHLDDNPKNNSAKNLAWSDHGSNRARKAQNERAGASPGDKIRKMPISLRLMRELQQRTGQRGQVLVRTIERLVRQYLDGLKSR
jgi:hypothetical protein